MTDITTTAPIPDSSGAPINQNQDAGRARGTRPKVPRTMRKETTKAHTRPPTKREQLIRLLSTKAGADTATIGAKLGWLPHTVRAALSGLRKAGQEIHSAKGEGGKPTRYRIAPRPSGDEVE